MAKIYYFDGQKLRTKSVLPSSEQYVGKRAPGTSGFASSVPEWIERLGRSGECEAVCAFSSLLLRHGLRVSDVLSIAPSNVSRTLTITVAQGKGSNKLFVQPIEYRGFWNRYRAEGIHFADCFDRHYMYRLFKRLGIYARYGSNKRLSVTHSGRHEVALESLADTGDLESITQRLGHKNNKTAIYYAKAKK